MSIQSDPKNFPGPSDNPWYTGHPAERWLSGRKRPPAKWVGDESCLSGSNPDLSARFCRTKTMRRIFFLGLTIFSVLSTAWSVPLSEYLKIRKQYGISQAVGVAALETLVGARTVEIKGTVKGTFGFGDESALLLEKSDGSTITVTAKQLPDFLTGNEVEARLIVRAEREDEYSEIKARLIAAATESSIAPIDAAAARKAASTSKASRGKTSSGLYGPIGRGGSVSKPPSKAVNWSLPASEVMPYYAQFIKSRNKRLSDGQAIQMANAIIGFSIQYGVDARLIMAMILVESGFNPSATSRAGAMGLGQLMPGTARGMGVNAYDPMQNLYATTRIVRGHLERYGKKTGGDSFQSLVLALAAYNAGSGNVRKHGGVPPFAETQRYIQKVVGWYNALSGRV